MKTKLPPSPFNLLNNNISSFFDSKEQKTQKMLTGIAFGDKEQLDFIGISSINDQLDLVSGHGEWRLRQEEIGHLFFDSENKKVGPQLIKMRRPLQIIRGDNNNQNNNNNSLPIRAISLKKQLKDGSVIAEFARPLAGDGEKLKTDLSKCTNFFLITKWINYNNSNNEEELPSILTTSSASIRKTVCSLVDECTINANEIIGYEENEEKKMKDLPPPVASSPEFAQSVDISGRGDPCKFIGPTYSIEWWIEINEKGEEIVNFLMKQKQRKGHWWSAIGIGDNMSDMDIGAIFLENGEPKAMIDYFSNSYELPLKDTKQDWKLDKKLSKWPNKLFIDDNNSENNIELYFSRKMTTEDIEKDKTMDGCVLFQFGANLGEYGSSPGFRLHKHQDWPDLYKACQLKKYCIRHKRQNGGNNRNNFVRKVNNIPPTLSHSTDEKQNENNLNNNSTDKAIQLLMKSLGPKIVQTVLESEKEENLLNKTKEEINEENNKNNGKATIIPLLINSNKQNNEGIQISEEDNFNNEDNKQNENNKTLIILSKRQEQQQILNKQNVSDLNNNITNKIETNGGGGLSQSPFSLSAFIGGGEQQQLNFNNESVHEGNESSSTISSIPQSGGGGITSENGIFPLNNNNNNNTLSNTTNNILPSPPRFGISQMLQEENNDNNKTINLTNISSSTSPSNLEENNNINNNNISNDFTTISLISSNENQTTITSTNNNEVINQTTIISSTTETSKNIEENSQKTTNIVETTTKENLTNNVLTTTELFLNETNNLNNNNKTNESPTIKTTLFPIETKLSNNTINSELIENTTISSDILNLEEDLNNTTLTSIGTSTIESTHSTTLLINTSTESNTKTSQKTTKNTPTNVYRTIKETEKHERETTINIKENMFTNSQTIEATTKKENNKNTSISPFNGSNEQPEERGIKLPVVTSKCDALRPDLAICHSYMDTYIERVKDWSERHGEPLERQYPKACRLLSAVPHVSTLCCQLFTDRCADFV